MPRCRSCPACSVLAAFKELNKGPSGRNKIRKKVKEHPCANPTASTKRDIHSSLLVFRSFGQLSQMM